MVGLPILRWGIPIYSTFAMVESNEDTEDGRGEAVAEYLIFRSMVVNGGDSSRGGVVVLIPGLL